MNNTVKNNYSILFIDDEEKSGKYFKKIFQSEFNVYISSSTDNALKILSKKSDEIAIVVSDQRMPKYTGVQLLNQIKTKHPNIIRILTTAYSDLQDNIRAINESNIFGYIAKPWKIEELQRIIYKALCEYKAKMTTLSLSGSIAHEIRNSINKINFSLHEMNEILDKEIKNTNKINIPLQQVKSSLENCHNSIDQANKIINLTLSNLKGGTANENLEKLSIIKIIEQAIDEYSYENSNQKKCILISEEIEDFIFIGNKISIIYVLFNLIKNALYFLPKHPAMNITFSSQKSNTDQFNYLYITDTSRGIENDKLELIFNDFITLNKSNGSGLGLSFCKRAMNSIDGDIKCESKLGKYTKFTLSFPVANNNDIQQDQQNNIKKILIIDDQEINLLTTKALIELNLENVSCTTMSSGLEITKKININEYGLILMDLQMPEIDGFETSNQIREVNKNIPIIAYTSISKKDIIKRKNTAIDDYIPKTISHDMLIKTASKWLIASYKDNKESITTDIARDILKNKKILIADEEEVNRTLIANFLKNKYNLIVEQVNDGQEAINKYIQNSNNSKSYDIILTDINMPKVKGFEACRKIKQYQTKNNLDPMRIVAISGDGNKQKIYNSFKFGIDDYFIKGTNPHDLAKIIAFWIKNTKEIKW